MTASETSSSLATAADAISASELWAQNTDLAEASLRDPFVAGIADGTLPLESFQHYVSQDVYFLTAFARGYALALAKAPDTPSMKQFKRLLDGVMDEQDLHATFAERWRVDMSDVQPTPATRAYTDFLLQVAALEPAGHVCAAMTPCMRLYAWLGQRLISGTSPDGDYAEWVQTYATDEFESLAAELESLLDHLGGDPAAIRSHYRTAMRLERDFFASAFAWSPAG